MSIFRLEDLSLFNLLKIAALKPIFKKKIDTYLPTDNAPNT